MPNEPSAEKRPAVALTLLGCGLAVAPILALILYVARYGVDLPLTDQWEFVPLLGKSYQGHITFHDLWQQHNEHRILFPRLVFLALAHLTHWNIRYELAANVLVAVGTFLAIAYQIRTTAKAIGGTYLLWTIPLISIMVFSLTQHENWLWGWELQVLMNVLAVVTGIVLLTSRPLKWSRLMASMLLGIVAVYSFANGIIYWPLGLLMLTLAGPKDRKSKGLALGAWSVVGFLTILSYTYHLQSSSDLTLVFRQPNTYIKFVLLFLGAPCTGFSPNQIVGASGAVGLVIAAAGCGLLIKRQRAYLPLLSPYIGLSLYAIASAMVTGLGRINLGSEQALATRYIAFSSLFWVADIVFLCLLAREMGSKRWSRPATAAIVAIGLLTAINSVGSVQLAKQRYSYMAMVRLELVSLKDENDAEAEINAMKHIALNPKAAQSRLWILKKHHLSLYRPNSDNIDVF